MFKRALTQADFILIAANLLPVFGVWFLGWNAKEVFIVYAMETIIIGVYTILKLVIATAVRKTDAWYYKGSSTKVSGLFFILFFMMHYGIFVAVQLGLFFGLSGMGDNYNVSFFNFIIKWPQLLSKESWIVMVVFFVSYGIREIAGFIKTGDYKTTPMMILMFQPYMRIFIQQFIVLLGAVFLVFGAGKIFILVFAFVKIAFELFFKYNVILKKATSDLRKESSKK